MGPITRALARTAALKYIESVRSACYIPRNVFVSFLYSEERKIGARLDDLCFFHSAVERVLDCF